MVPSEVCTVDEGKNFLFCGFKVIETIFSSSDPSSFKSNISITIKLMHNLKGNFQRKRTRWNINCLEIFFVQVLRVRNWKTSQVLEGTLQKRWVGFNNCCEMSGKKDLNQNFFELLMRESQKNFLLIILWVRKSFFVGFDKIPQTTSSSSFCIPVENL